MKAKWLLMLAGPAPCSRLAHAGGWHPTRAIGL
jgi:hypothetical protein